MIRLLNWLFGAKKQNGQCKWWGHNYDNGERIYSKYPTGTYVGDEPILRSYNYVRYTCKKCRKTVSSH